MCVFLYMCESVYEYVKETGTTKRERERKRESDFMRSSKLWSIHACNTHPPPPLPLLPQPQPNTAHSCMMFFSPLLTSQLGVRAYDSARPSQVASANVTIAVNRNPSIPVFQRLTQVISILETQNLGEVIASVQALDADGVRKTDRWRDKHT